MLKRELAGILLEPFRGTGDVWLLPHLIWRGALAPFLGPLPKGWGCHRQAGEEASLPKPHGVKMQVKGLACICITGDVASRD